MILILQIVLHNEDTLTLYLIQFYFQHYLPLSSSWSSPASWHNNLHVSPSLLSGTFHHSSAPETRDIILKASISSEDTGCYLPAACTLVVFQVRHINMAEPAYAIGVVTFLGASLICTTALSRFSSLFQNLLNHFPVDCIRVVVPEIRSWNLEFCLLTKFGWHNMWIAP